MPRVPFAINSYRHESLPLSAQRVVNWYPETQPVDAKTRVPLLPWPGLKAFTTAGSGPIRNQTVMNGVLYAVSGNRLYSVDASGVASDKGSVGINATGLVSAAHNGTQLVIVNDNKGWIYNRNTDLLTQITDPDFRSATAVIFLDGYHIFIELNSDTFFISALDDPTAYAALDFAVAEGDPDNLINLTVNARQLLLFGRQSVEPWYNSGDTFPFDRLSGAYVEKGIAAKYSLVNMDNSVFWLGSDKKVYRLDGFTPTRVSTHAIEQAIEKFSDVGDAEGNRVSWKGHDFYVLTFPGQASFVYDAATRLWHERQSYGDKDFRGCCITEAYNRTVIGDRTGNALYTLDGDTFTDAGEPLVCSATGAPYYAAGEEATMGEFEAIFEMGLGATTGQGENPQAMLRYSNDGGKTWSPEQWRSIGKRGEYDRVAVWNRLGGFMQRVVEVTVSDPIGPRLLGANADIEA